MTTPANAVPAIIRADAAGNLYYSLDNGLTFNPAVAGGGGTIHTSAPLSGDGSVGTPATIAAGAIALSKLATEADQTVVGNVSGGSASPVALTATQVKTFLALAPGSERTAMENKLSSLLGVTNLNSLYFSALEQSTNAWGATVTGTGTQQTAQDADASNAAFSAGGFFVQATGTGTGSLFANDAFVQTADFAGRPDVLKYNDASVKFGMGWIGNILSTPDADTFISAGTQNVQYGVIGSISTTKFALAIGNNLGASIVSTVSIDTNQHSLWVWQDGTNFWFQVDNETAQSTGSVAKYPLNGSTGKSSPLLIANKTGNAVNHIFGTRSAIWMCQTP